MTRELTCRQSVKVLLDYAEERLPGGPRAALERHLTRCPPCAAFLMSYRRTPEIVRRHTDTPAEPALTQRLLAAFDRLGDRLSARRPSAAATPRRRTARRPAGGRRSARR